MYPRIAGKFETILIFWMISPGSTKSWRMGDGRETGNQDLVNTGALLLKYTSRHLQ